MAGGHFTYLSPFIADENVQKFVTALVVGGGLIYLGSRAASALRRRDGIADRIVPTERAGLFGSLDLLLEGLLNLFDSVLGKHNRRYFPLCATNRNRTGSFNISSNGKNAPPRPDSPLESSRFAVSSIR